MTSFLQKISLGIVFITIGFFAQQASAQVVDDYYYVGQPYGSSLPYYGNQYSGVDNSALILQLIQLIEQLQAQLQLQGQNYNYNYQPYNYGNPYTYFPVDVSSSNGRPDVTTRSARDVEDDQAELRGDVDMNDFRNGIVFFVYGQDEDMIEDVEDDYDTYEDVNDDEDDDDFEVKRVDSDLDDDESYEQRVTNLEEEEDYFFIICVEYEDEDNDERLECGDVEEFETDGDSDDKPDAETRSATDIQDDQAKLRGDVDMNDFDNGYVFFVYGENEGDIEDVENEDRYFDIDVNGDDIQKVVVDYELDGSSSYDRNVFSLDGNTDHYFRICVEYEDDDNDDRLECGDVENFETN